MSENAGGGASVRRWIVVPYDGSPAARAVLRQAARAATRAVGLYHGIVVATVGLEPGALEVLLAETAARTGRALPARIHWLSPTDPIGALRALLAGMPDATLAVPLGGRGRAPWFGQACRLGDLAARTMVFFLTPRELQTAADAVATVPRRAAFQRPLSALRCTAAWLFARPVATAAYSIPHMEPRGDAGVVRGSWSERPAPPSVPGERPCKDRA